MIRAYSCLSNQKYSIDNYSIIPIRFTDRLLIMKWRNEQMYHLRQKKILTETEQNLYFESVIEGLFKQNNPDQILFSFLEDSKCVGYGGLVHINWVDKNAEISFIINTELESTLFHHHWTVYLSLIEEVAFKQLNLHKIYTYAFDIRPQLYRVLEDNQYTREATIKEHVFIEGIYKDVVIHCKLNDGK
jgi:RimJ/RimL family protein N-acetyltransferase